ncbi:ADP-heptose:LPS heptosyltransferase [Georgenia soli]|uniref:ADP-heptose:LPS heptosyltransferase n=1 Tax=Georgenia soli TaxID=638953 RepID=A0A2A9EMW1_9MICO|nr:glycosyltransferase family 9 protein [Georgenia soli]PFG39946.1 ADP-heptose:LPS heptosyltransferase [Georgenia soli]
MTRVLAVRLDNDGDVLLAGPAVRALAPSADSLDMLVSPAGQAAARLLPGVSDVLVADVPWSGYAPAPADASRLQALVALLAERHYDRCTVFTSFHQSPLPMALIARMAGIGYVAATSVDYPGSLLDVRHQRPEGLHEVEAALDLVRATGVTPPADDDGRLALRRPLPPVPALVPAGPYVVVHPGASVPARAMTPDHARAIVAALRAAGWPVVVTGGPSERELAAVVAGPTEAASRPAAGPAAPARVIDLAGRTDLAELAAVLDGAACVVVGNTGPAHLAAAVGTPVVSLFSPVVPAGRWAPYGVPSVVLGDQQAPCRGSRARECPVPGHPCLTGVPPEDVVAAVDSLAGSPSSPVPPGGGKSRRAFVPSPAPAPTDPVHSTAEVPA